MGDLLLTISRLRGDSRLFAKLDDGSDRPDAAEASPVALDVDRLKLDTRENVAAYGKAVRDALNPAIGPELDTIFNRLTDQPSSIKFFLQGGEQIRWETLRGDGLRSYLALDSMCPLARVTAASLDAKPRNFDYPLRMLAYLSAAGESAEDEFINICNRIVASRGQGLPIECAIYLGEQRLLDQPQQIFSAANLKAKRIDANLEANRISVSPMPNALEIEKRLINDTYQFLHFFCHGVEKEAGMQGLSLATINDHDKNDAMGGASASSVFLSAETLRTALALNKSAWIAVLNSCSGAEAPPQLYSTAFNVAKFGCPYVLGMAEPIEPKIAKMFSDVFYRELFSTVMNTLKNGAPDAQLVLELSGAVTPARKEIYDYCDNDKDGAFGRWLLPLIYLKNRQPLTVVQSIDPATWKRVQLVARTLRAMPSDTPDELRLQLLAILDKPVAVPARLRPNAYGIFS
jgi:CHAT domain